MRSPQSIKFEPFKIKMVEPLNVNDPLTAESVARRSEILVQAKYNVFKIPAKEVVIDLLTDSGTGAMSQEQWAAMMVGDESYAQAKSFENFSNSIQSVIGEEFLIIPTHQGRAAENILFYVLNNLARDKAKHGDTIRRRVLINSFFDTTAGNIMLHGSLTADDWHKSGVNPLELSDRAERQVATANLKQSVLIVPNQLVVDQTKPEAFEHQIFGGNIDLNKLEEALSDEKTRAEVMLVMMTTTNNTGGGLPVSLANLRAVRDLIDHYCANDEPLFDGAPPMLFFLDACRFAENAYYIQQHEPGQENRSVADISREMFSLVDGCTMSAKKDGMANIGGFLATRSDKLREMFWEHMVEIEGFYTYGGLSGRDLEAVAVGIKEGVDDARVAQRVEQVRRLWGWLKEEGVPVKEPCGGHGVFLKGREFWKKGDDYLIEARDLQGHTLALELYRRYGIRSCEIGTIMFGDFNPATGKPDRVAPNEDYVRLAIPRRTYTDQHLEYVAAAISELYHERETCPWRGMKFSYRPPALPHFLSFFEPILA